MRNDMNISFFDVYACIYLYIIYIFLLLVILNVFLKKNIDIINIFTNDITNEKYDISQERYCEYRRSCKTERSRNFARERKRNFEAERRF